jgi:hypothetical protein
VQARLSEFVMRWQVASLGLAVILTVGACAPLASGPCRPGQDIGEVAELFFGLSRTSEQEWRDFLASVVTPRFPDGLTVVDAQGQWRNPQREVVIREPSKVVVIAIPKPSEEINQKLQEIISRYKARFRQQSVGLIVRPSCVSF